MAVECVDSAIYVSKILSERRKVNSQFISLYFADVSFFKTWSRIFYNPLQHVITFSFFFQAKKPLMEKMRRARINDSLNEMKSLVLDLLHKDVSLTFLWVAFKNQNN